MSYILEALRKAEQERNPVQSGITQSVPPRPRLINLSKLSEFRSYRPLLVAGLCGGLILTLTISLFQRHHSVAPVAAIAPNPVQVAAPAGNANLIQPSDQMVGNGPTSLDDIVENDNGAATASSDSFSNPGNSFSASDETPLAAAIPAPAPSPQRAETTEAAEVAPSEPAQEMPVTTVEHLKLDAAPAPQIQKLSEMPADYRATFPQLSLDVHSYDKSPKKRFIMIGGRRYNEGDALSEGPHIAQIVPEGVVFDFRGEQVLFPIAH